MKILREGDRGRAICLRCEKLVSTRYEYRPFRLEKTDTLVDNVLVGVCEECDETVTIPAQSTPKLKEARGRQLEPFNARLPQHLEDVLHLIADQYNVSYSDFCGAVVRFYIHELGAKDEFARRVSQLARSELAKGRACFRISVRIEKASLEAAWEASKRAGLNTRTDMLKGMIVAAKEDIIDGKASRRRQTLEDIAACI